MLLAPFSCFQKKLLNHLTNTNSVQDVAFSELTCLCEMPHVTAISPIHDSANIIPYGKNNDDDDDDDDDEKYSSHFLLKRDH